VGTSSFKHADSVVAIYVRIGSMLSKKGFA
jgi:hypothetical protein